MRRAQGYAQVIGPTTLNGRPVGPKALQANDACDTFTCKHCQRIVHVPARADPASIGGLCGGCAGLICPTCVAKRRCTPWEKQLAKMEARHEALRSYGLA